MALKPQAGFKPQCDSCLIWKHVAGSELAQRGWECGPGVPNPRGGLSQAPLGRCPGPGKKEQALGCAAGESVSHPVMRQQGGGGEGQEVCTLGLAPHTLPLMRCRWVKGAAFSGRPKGMWGVGGAPCGPVSPCFEVKPQPLRLLYPSRWLSAKGANIFAFPPFLPIRHLGLQPGPSLVVSAFTYKAKREGCSLGRPHPHPHCS